MKISFLVFSYISEESIPIEINNSIASSASLPFARATVKYLIIISSSLKSVFVTAVAVVVVMFMLVVMVTAAAAMVVFVKHHRFVIVA